jgi:hypothetical protein
MNPTIKLVSILLLLLKGLEQWRRVSATLQLKMWMKIFRTFKLFHPFEWTVGVYSVHTRKLQRSLPVPNAEYVIVLRTVDERKELPITGVKGLSHGRVWPENGNSQPLTPHIPTS